MSSKTYVNNELILDITGEPLDKNFSLILRAINQLMTVGTYYSHDHDQYILASHKACENIVRGIGGRQSVIIEIGSEGMMMGNQTVAPSHREVRQLYELLVPLNIARLEIDQKLEPAHLRTGLGVLLEYKLKLGSRKSFKEVRIDGLPPTIRTIGCHLFSHNELAALDVEEPASIKNLAHKFLDLVGEIIANVRGNHSSGTNGANTADQLGGPGGELPADLGNLVEGLKELVRIESDPHNLLTLIQNAQKALELSHDPDSVDLVFRLLRTELKRNKHPVTSTKLPPVEKVVKWEQSISGLRDQLALTLTDASAAGSLDLRSTKCDFLGICFQVLQAKPSDSLEVHLVAAFELALNAPEIGIDEVQLCARGVAAAMEHDRVAASERIVGVVLKILRQSHLELLPDFWLMLWSLLDREQHGYVWPLLVNDILLGTGDSPPEIKASLLEAVGSVSLPLAKRNRRRLFGLPAFRSGKASTTIFSVPPARLYALHAVMLESPLVAWHGPRLQRLIMRQSSNDLACQVVRFIGDFRRENGPLLAGLLEEQAKNTLSGDLKETVGQLLKDGLLGLAKNRRGEDWVINAVGWLDRINHESAVLVIDHILHDRKLWFFKAWPPECREAVEGMVQTWSSASAT